MKRKFVSARNQALSDIASENNYCKEALSLLKLDAFHSVRSFRQSEEEITEEEGWSDRDIVYFNNYNISPHNYNGYPSDYLVKYDISEQSESSYKEWLTGMNLSVSSGDSYNGYRQELAYNKKAKRRELMREKRWAKLECEQLAERQLASDRAEKLLEQQRQQYLERKLEALKAFQQAETEWKLNRLDLVGKWPPNPVIQDIKENLEHAQLHESGVSLEAPHEQQWLIEGFKGIMNNSLHRFAIENNVERYQTQFIMRLSAPLGLVFGHLINWKWVEDNIPFSLIFNLDIDFRVVRAAFVNYADRMARRFLCSPYDISVCVGFRSLYGVEIHLYIENVYKETF